MTGAPYSATKRDDSAQTFSKESLELSFRSVAPSSRLRSDVDIFSKYIPSAGPFVPIKDLTTFFPKLTYQLFFGLQTPDAVEELDRDIRRISSGHATCQVEPAPLMSF